MGKATTRSIALAACLTMFASPALVAYASTVTVQPGQTLWGIAQAHHTTVAQIHKLNPNLHGETIQIGMKLTLPGGVPSSKWSANRVRPVKQKVTVHAGDTLWSLATAYHTSVGRLQALNPQLRNSVTIRIGDSLWVPTGNRSASSGSRPTPAPVTMLSGRSAAFGPPGATLAAENLYWMARVIHAEAGSQPLKSKIAVGDVVWHRMLAQPGSTVKDIVFEQTNGNYQFSTVPEGAIYESPDPLSVTAAVDVLEKHEDVVPGAYVFYDTSQRNNPWVYQQPTVANFNGFVFAK